MSRRYGKRKEDVFAAICALGEEFNTPPTQKQIAKHLGIPQSYVSQLMFRLEQEGRIKFLTRYTYTVTDSSWEAPPEVNFPFRMSQSISP